MPSKQNKGCEDLSGRRIKTIYSRKMGSVIGEGSKPEMFKIRWDRDGGYYHFGQPESEIHRSCIVPL